MTADDTENTAKRHAEIIEAALRLHPYPRYEYTAQNPMVEAARGRKYASAVCAIALAASCEAERLSTDRLRVQNAVLENKVTLLIARMKEAGIQLPVAEWNDWLSAGAA